MLPPQAWDRFRSTYSRFLLTSRLKPDSSLAATSIDNSIWLCVDGSRSVDLESRESSHHHGWMKTDGNRFHAQQRKTSQTFYEKRKRLVNGRSLNATNSSRNLLVDQSVTFFGWRAFHSSSHYLSLKAHWHSHCFLRWIALHFAQNTPWTTLPPFILSTSSAIWVDSSKT